MTAERYTEQYEFSCRCCGVTWRETYAVLQLEDQHGDVRRYHRIRGAPAAAPTAVDVCPSCRQLGVRARLVDQRPVRT